MKFYLDTCSLQRPLDDKSQLRIQLEAEAILAILMLCKDGDVARFIQQFTTGYGDYTAERDQIIGDQTVDEIVAEIERYRQTKAR